MSLEYCNKEWMIDLNARPHQFSTQDPPFDDDNEHYPIILSSISAMTLAESFFIDKIDFSFIEHVENERIHSQKKDLHLIWSDEVSLTLTFLASLAHNGEYSQEHLLQRYFNWWMNGYMCPAGLCFTPNVHIKKSIDLFGETQAAQAMGLEINLAEKFHNFTPTPSSILRVTPIAYFYAKHPYEYRLNIVQDCVKRMFGPTVPVDGYIKYVELLVNALNGHSKQYLLKSIKLKSNSNDMIHKILCDLFELLSNDNDDIEQGIEKALSKIEFREISPKYHNPLDANQSLLLTLYLQLSSAIYKTLPDYLHERVHAKQTISSLTKWIIYERESHLQTI